MPDLGLYYAFIHFRSDAWVKLAILHWDRMGRIVPEGYLKRDSETVQELVAAGFIEDVDPAGAIDIIGNVFLDLIKRYEQPLRTFYRVPDIDSHPVDPDESFGHPQPQRADTRFAYIYTTKVPADLVLALRDTKLGDFNRRGNSGSVCTRNWRRSI